VEILRENPRFVEDPWYRSIFHFGGWSFREIPGGPTIVPYGYSQIVVYPDGHVTWELDLFPPYDEEGNYSWRQGFLHWINDVWPTSWSIDYVLSWPHPQPHPGQFPWPDLVGRPVMYIRPDKIAFPPPRPPRFLPDPWPPPWWFPAPPESQY